MIVIRVLFLCCNHGAGQTGKGLELDKSSLWAIVANDDKQLPKSKSPKRAAALGSSVANVDVKNIEHPPLSGQSPKKATPAHNADEQPPSGLPANLRSFLSTGSTGSSTETADPPAARVSIVPEAAQSQEERNAAVDDAVEQVEMPAAARLLSIIERAKTKSRNTKGPAVIPQSVVRPFEMPPAMAGEATFSLGIDDDEDEVFLEAPLALAIEAVMNKAREMALTFDNTVYPESALPQPVQNLVEPDFARIASPDSEEEIPAADASLPVPVEEPAAAVLRIVEQHESFGPHKVLQRHDGSRFHKEFDRHPGTTMVEHKNGNRIWMFADRAISVETKEGVWGTNDGGMHWMRKDPPGKSSGGSDFRAWQRTSARINADQWGNVTIEQKGCAITYFTDGTKNIRQDDGTIQHFNAAGLLETKTYPNGACEMFTYTDGKQQVRDRRDACPGQARVERDQHDRPFRMWSPFGYKLEIAYDDESGEASKVTDTVGLELVRVLGPRDRLHWVDGDGSKRNISDLTINEQGLLSFKETLDAGGILSWEIQSDGRYHIEGTTEEGDDFAIDGCDGKPTCVVPPGGDKYTFEYDQNGDLVKVATGKYGRSYEKISGQWQQIGVNKSAGKGLELIVKVDRLGDLSITHQVTADYYAVQKRQPQGFQSQFTMDMRQGKWTSSERITAREVTKTVESDSGGNRAETIYNHKTGGQLKIIRDVNEAGYEVLIDKANHVLVQQMGPNAVPCGYVSSSEGKRWTSYNVMGDQIAEFEATIDAHRDGLTIRGKTPNGAELILRTNASGIPLYAKYAGAEWNSKDGLNWLKDNGPGREKDAFCGRWALADCYPIVGHTELVEKSETLELAGEGHIASADDGRVYSLVDDRWSLLQDRDDASEAEDEFGSDSDETESTSIAEAAAPPS